MTMSDTGNGTPPPASVTASDCPQGAMRQSPFKERPAMAAARKLKYSHFDTQHDEKPKAREVTREEFLEVLTRHKVGPKDGSMFSPVSYLPGAKRGVDGVHERYYFMFDIEANKKTGEVPPPPDLTGVHMFEMGIAGAVVTTHRHTPEAPRYRVCVDIAEPIDISTPEAQAADKAMQWGILRMLGLEGVIDSATMDVSRGFFHPRHPEGAQVYANAVDCLPLDKAILAEAERIGREMMAEAAGPALPLKQPKQKTGNVDPITLNFPDDASIDMGRIRQRRAAGPNSHIIEAFNRARPLHELLSLYGYDAGPNANVQGEAARRYHAPFQTSPSWGMTVFSDRWVGMSGSFHDVGIGQDSKGKRYGDGFDLYVHHEHGGRFDVAVAKAAESLGLTRDPFDGVDITGTVAALTGKDGKAKDKTGDKPAAGPEAGEEMTDDIEDALNEELLAAEAPVISDDAFYGILRPIVDATTLNSEATRVGVAAHLMASVSTLLSPFRVDLGDDRLGLNLFLSIVGWSARGRKGTSSAPTDLHIMPAIHHGLEQYATAVANARQTARNAQAAVAAKQQRAAAIEARIVAVRSLTQADIDDRSAKAKELTDKAANVATRIAEFKAKLDNPRLSPDTLRKYEKAHSIGAAELDGIELELASVKASIADDQRALANRPQALADLAPELAKVQSEVAVAIAAAAQVKPSTKWQLLFTTLAQKPHKLSGVASGEGLIYAVRDPSEGGSDGEEDPGVAEKRFLISLSEMGSLLALASRPGNTLSPVIRNIYDCQPLQTNAKVKPVGCEQPFGSISGSVTPEELCGLMFSDEDKSANADNGFGNRFMFLFTVRNKLIAHPVASVGLDKFGQRIAQNIKDVYATLQPEGPHLSTPIGMTPGAHKLWEQLYPEVEAWEAGSKNAKRLFGRMSTNVRKVAAVLAIINGEPEVTEGALKAAVAWLRHAAATVNFIASKVAERRAMNKQQAMANWIIEKVRAAGTGITTRDLCRLGNHTAPAVKAGLDIALRQAPCPLKLETVFANGGNGAKKKRVLIWPA